MILGNTIFALSSGSGRAGIAVVRISGPAALTTFSLFSVLPPQPRQAAVRRLKNREGEVIDEALVLWLPGPGSATGEDMAELHLHGAPAVVSAVIEELGTAEGFGLAEPGAFTYRAFRNNRLDLLQVEGLADVLASQSADQRRLAMRQFLGEASSIYETWRAELLKALALIEAAIDFSDEDDVAKRAFSEARGAMERLSLAFESALGMAERAAVVRRGMRVVLAGAPNVGKSSLLNWLVGREAAIVSSVAGTTRDVVDAPFVLAGVPIVASDTAGLRFETTDEIEQEGMRRTQRAVGDADILVWIEAAGSESDLVSPRLPDLVVVNKIDRGNARLDRWATGSVWPLSAKTGQGLEAFREGLANLIRERNHLGEDAVVVRERHRQALQSALMHLRDASGAAELGLEFVAEDMRKAAQVLAAVTGRVDVEDLLGHIFKDFCIGK